MKDVSDEEQKELLTDSIEGSWSIVRSDSGLSLCCSDVSEKYMIFDELTDLLRVGSNYFLSEAKANELYDDINHNIDFINSKIEAETQFESRLVEFQNEIHLDEQSAYRAYLKNVKDGIGGSDWIEAAMPRTEFLKQYRVLKATEIIKNYKNDKLYEKYTPYNLRGRKQFVIWKYEQVKDKDGQPTGQITKVPYNPANGHKVSVASSNWWGWSDFETACNAVDKYGAHGIGFVFKRGKNNVGVVGIDIDHCIENGNLSETAKDILDSVDSYTEYSPSGTGLHIFCFGDVPKDAGNRKGSVEIYAEDRFFTLTGNPYEGIFKKIPRAEDTQEGLKKVFETYVKREVINSPQNFSTVLTMEDEKVIRKCMNFKNKDFFDDLFNKGVTNRFLHDDGTPDYSAHDVALCSMLAYFTDDAKQIDRIFRKSRIMRAKWDDNRGGTTYGERTIKTALQQRTARFDPAFYRDREIEKWFKTNSNIESSIIPDEEIIAMCRRDKQSGVTFEKMFDQGEMDFYLKKDGTPDIAKHEYSLLWMIARQSSDPAQVNRVFHQSRIMRPEWDEKGDHLCTRGEKLIYRVFQDRQRKANGNYSRTTKPKQKRNTNVNE